MGMSGTSVGASGETAEDIGQNPKRKREKDIVMAGVKREAHLHARCPGHPRLSSPSNF
jgi:hypothetical protein